MSISVTLIIVVLVVIGLLMCIFGPLVLSWKLAPTRNAAVVTVVQIPLEDLEAAGEYEKLVFVDLQVMKERPDILWGHIKVSQPHLLPRTILINATSCSP